MLQTPVLTEQNLKDYERDGFVIVRNAFNAADAAKIKQWTVELVELPEESIVNLVLVANVLAPVPILKESAVPAIQAPCVLLLPLAS